MTPARLLAELAERGIALACGPGGRPRLVDPERQLTHSALLRLLWDPWVLEWALAGSRTGHYWHGCDTCGEIQMLAKSRPGQKRSCRLTPGCEGIMGWIPLQVPERPKHPTRRTVRVPFQKRTPRGAPRRRKGSSSKRTPARPASPGDLLALVACPTHTGRRWVKSAFVAEWRCAVRLDDADGARECALPARCLALGVITAGGYPEITEPAPEEQP